LAILGISWHIMNATLMETAICPSRAGELAAELAALRREVERLRRQLTELRCEAGYWKSRHADALERNESLRDELAQAKGENRKLRQRLFGRKSERRAANERANLLEQAAEEPKPQRKRGAQPGQKGHGRRDYSRLPAREESIEIPQDQRVCPRCGKPMRELGETEDSEQIEIEVEIYRQVLHRKRYRSTCSCHGCTRTITAPSPPKLIPKSRLGTSLWVHLLLSKFAFHQPIDRSIKQLKQLGLDLPSGSVTDGLRRIEPMLRPVYDALVERNRQSVFHQADETRWLVFVETAGKTGFRWWLWVFADGQTVVYRLDPGRSRHVPQGHLGGDTRGVLLVDRYSAYKAMDAVKSGSLLLAFCWAHVRRDFLEVGKGYPELADWAVQWLKRIRQLYRLNRRRLKHAVGSAEFNKADQALRSAVEEMQGDFTAELADENLRQPCRKVLESLRNHWEGLTLFVARPEIPMDNNAAERLMRGPALGRKNYCGSGAKWSGRLAETMFSMVATMACWDVNPRTWLTWYLEACAAAGGRAPDDIEQFLPWNLSAERRAALADQPTASRPTLNDTS
jgi:transposase